MTAAPAVMTKVPTMAGPIPPPARRPEGSISLLNQSTLMTDNPLLTT